MASVAHVCFCSSTSRSNAILPKYRRHGYLPSSSVGFGRSSRKSQNTLFGLRNFRSTKIHPTLCRASTELRVSEEMKPIKLTYLEGNSWLWSLGGVNILVDPILVGKLDFGIPWLYEAAKKYITNEFQIEDLPELDCLLITQGLDDHCHVKTLEPLSKINPSLQVISTLNAESLLNPLFTNVKYLEPGQSLKLVGKNSANFTVQATPGPVLGPPWQRPENGYIVSSEETQLSLYYEPHCSYDPSLLNEYRADVVITPVVKQLLPSFTLVSGQEDAVELAKLLGAKYVIAMKNGDLDAKGLLTKLITNQGSTESFKKLASKDLPEIEVLEPIPGIALELPVNSEIPA
ncbi:Zn-dependent hydrolase (Beta-lactamase fold protein) [Zostera marina]|uniref:Zn-dependent hydrolase (Beta-lactamase fold protein) n=1 Tax=Zostera marina TaxID=29655 RepID=A0A0K9Q596_ZOSMR|nr:Zn-dependent hydrolase (Beta-lactamase fold protein) [Zostera marina]